MIEILKRELYNRYGSCSEGTPKTGWTEPAGSLGAMRSPDYPLVLKPNEINFSQRTVSGNVNQYTQDMISGNWTWNESNTIRVMKRDGQWVSYDNRRLMAAQNAGIDSIPVKVVDPTELVPGRNITWEQAFTERFNDFRNIKVGGPVPNSGLSSQPTIAGGR